MKYTVQIITMCLLTVSTGLFSQTISEKKAGLNTNEGGDLTKEAERFLTQVNRELDQKQFELKELYSKAQDLYSSNAPEESYQQLIEKIAKVKEEIVRLQNEWRELAVQSGTTESYALWHQPDTTLEQVVIDYGSNDYVYIMSPEIASMSISVDSNLPIPRASWNEVLELILSYNGVGIQQLNPFLRQLFLLKDRKASIQLITNNPEDLTPFPSNARVCFLLTPDPTDARRVSYFLENFVNPNRTIVQLVGRDILVVGEVGEIYDLLKLYDFITTNRGEKEYKAVSLTKVRAEEMARILGAIFDRAEVQHKGSMKSGSKGSQTPEGFADGDTNGLKIIVLDKITEGLFLVGTRDEIRKAELAIEEVESQVGESREKIIYWYTAKHSDPEDLADVLERIYYLMVSSGTGFDDNTAASGQTNTAKQNVNVKVTESAPSFTQPLYLEGNYPINPAPVEPANPDIETSMPDRQNFIVDPKTSSIVMVVEAEILPQLKDVIRRLDVPKKMVQLEVLLFEKKLNKETDFGLNMLKVGQCAKKKNENCLDFNGLTGLLSFMVSKKASSGIPGYDLTYNFLLSQDNITINSAPSVLTVNQTPAFISIQDEISLNTGTFEIPENNGVATLKDAYVRAQYGITIKITPTIHSSDSDSCNNEPDSVTLVSDILFDTFQRGDNPQRPDVTRRQVKNEARVLDGQSVILGGLRRKISEDSKQSIPFIGEIPGLGKLFSNTKMDDFSTEMFVFITPKIIYDPSEDLERAKRDLLTLRPGDIPEYLCQLVQAREADRNALLQDWITILFGPEPERCFRSDWHGGEYDGR